MDRAPQTLLARALYDNQADGPDELAFCRGDILTVLEQNVAGSEGWWQCLLHGRPGLAPANRLQVLPDRQTPTGRAWPPAPGGRADARSEQTYQVPALLRAPPAGPVYEPMKSWVEGPPPATAQVYELPNPAAPGVTPGGALGTAWDGGDQTRVGARIVCEKPGRPAQQVLVTIPRPAWASLPTRPPQVPEAPAQEPAKQQLYDVPQNPQRSALGGHHSSGQTLPLTSAAVLRPGGYSTLPTPQKSEWVYDTPGPPQPAHTRGRPLTSFTEAPGPRSVPRHTSSFLVPRTTKSIAPQNVSAGKKSGLPEAPSDGGPAPRAEQGTRYKVPSSFQSPRVEAQNTKPNVYDIPQGREGVPQPEKEPGKTPGGSEPLELAPSWFPRQATWPGPDPDRASVASSDSRAGMFSSCSSSSSDSSSSSCSEESAWEPPMDLSTARETVTALQRHVAGSVAGLMLFVSRTWRFRDHLEANIASIRSAADHVEVSLREFLDFAQGVHRMAACHLTDGVLQARIRDQLQTISNSYQVLLEAKGALEAFDWSLEVLATDQLQNNPDDLERFVMAARMVPEDSKRFASMVIANGRLLFGQKGERETPSVPKAECELEKHALLLSRGTESPQRHAPCTKQRTAGHSPALSESTRPSVCPQDLVRLEENEKPASKQRLPEDRDLNTQRPGSVLPRNPSQRDPEKRAPLSEHGRLYFGALLKAVGEFSSSLHAGQPPEVFITQSKLVIMVGQKLVDTLCQETQDRDTRNEILCGSSQLCALLRDLALATKRAVLQHPSPDALAHLQAEATLLEQHTQQFRAMLE